MTKRPLLVFPRKSEASRTKKPSGRSPYQFPSSDTQEQRIFPKIQQLQKELQHKQIELQKTIDGADPEQVLVLEIIGSVENFIDTIKKIDGFEWLGETDIDEITPDKDFYNSKYPDKLLGGRLYAVMTNAKALKELLSMWKKWQKNNKFKFERGLNKFKDVFKSLKDVRYWNEQDRLLETGTIEYWEESLQQDQNQSITFEIELWFRNSDSTRAESENQITSLVQQLDGNVLNSCIIKEIAYHAVLAELPAKAITQIIAHKNTELVKCDGIMFFRPIGQTNKNEDISPQQKEVESGANKHPKPKGNPLVALLDGLPIGNHDLLAERLIIDDPDGWESSYRLQDRNHGTTMSSLIVHGDLHHNQPPLTTPLYVRPIMKPDSSYWGDPKPEFIPKTLILVDLIHRAVKRISEEQPSIKIINLSVGDSGRRFGGTMSPWARLLDWLSSKYNVLFIVSAGNHSSNIKFGHNPDNLKNLDEKTRKNQVIEAVYNNSHNRKIFSPAESINCITVGAAHNDGCQNIVKGSEDFNPFESNFLPSPFSAFGSGYRKSIKPDIIFPGGRKLYRKTIGKNEIQLVHNIRLGNKVACLGNQGELDNTISTSGASNATALLSRASTFCHQTLENIFQDSETSDHESCITSLIKAMLVHGCSWDEIGKTIKETFSDKNLSSQEIQQLIAKWAGYGMPNIDRVLECTEQRGSVVGFGKLKNDEAHIFYLPLPPSLSSKTQMRRITVTLAWMSPTVPTNQRYRQAGLWYELLDDEGFVETRTDAYWRATRRGTIQHEVFESDKAIPFEDGSVLPIKVNCTNDAGKIETPVPYGIVVSMEVKEGVNFPVYEEIRDRLSLKIKTPSIRISPTQNSFDF